MSNDTSHDYQVPMNCHYIDQILAAQFYNLQAQRNCSNPQG